MHPPLQAGPTKSSDDGFTLIEMAIVFVILGILVAIAIPLFSNYRDGALNKSAASDVRNGVAVVELTRADTPSDAYPVTHAVSKNAIVFDADHALHVSPGNYVGYTNLSSAYVICGWNPEGRTLYTYQSVTGTTTVAPNSPQPTSC